MNLSKKISQNYSEYLSFRSFYTGFPISKFNPKEILNIEEAQSYLKDRLGKLSNAAILLSGGMDSAILLPFMPKNTVAYTIFHEALDEESEVDLARSYCEKYGIKHKVVKIQPQDYIDCIDDLMINKGMPLSPAEPIFYLASKAAVADGFNTIVTGAGADTGFGGFSKDRRKYTIKGFQKRLWKSYISPKKTLNQPSTVYKVLNCYTQKTGSADRPHQRMLKKINPIKRKKQYIDTRRFLYEISFERFAYNNAINLAGAEHIWPLKEISYNFDEKKNQKRPKYFIRDIYQNIYGVSPPKKLGLQKPSFLLGDYQPSNFNLFKADLNINKLPYNKKFLIYCLERFEQLRLDKKVKIED